MDLPLLAMDADFAYAANVASACPGYVEHSVETGKFHCRNCPNSYKDLANVIIHTSNSHPEHFLANHPAPDDPAKPFTCHLCDAAYKQGNGLAYHLRAAHAGEKMGRKVATKKYDCSGRTVKCPLCPRLYKTAKIMKYHLKNKHAGLGPGLDGTWESEDEVYEDAPEQYADPTFGGPEPSAVISSIPVPVPIPVPKPKKRKAQQLAAEMDQQQQSYFDVGQWAAEQTGYVGSGNSFGDEGTSYGTVLSFAKAPEPGSVPPKAATGKTGAKGTTRNGDAATPGNKRKARGS